METAGEAGGGGGKDENGIAYEQALRSRMGQKAERKGGERGIAC